jgi:hypothetical protein
MQPQASVVSKTCKYTGKPVHCVEFWFVNSWMRTSWTTYANEARAWADCVRMTGWCVSGRPLPIPAKAEG